MSKLNSWKKIVLIKGVVMKRVCKGGGWKNLYLDYESYFYSENPTQVFQ